MDYPRRAENFYRRRLHGPILREEGSKFGSKHAPRRLVRQEHMVLALKRYEARVRNRGGNLATLIKRHADLTATRQIAPIPKITFSAEFPQKQVSILGAVR
ncbi:hypothetical protein ACVMH6_001825 [Rhizobium leguminosarum]